MTTPDIPLLTPAQVRQHLLDRHEIALVDVREEDPFAQAHPLWAVQIGAGRIALDAPWRLPRRDVTIAVYDNGEGLASPAAQELQALGYTRVHLLDGGLAAWRDAGGELFRDVNVPSKSFGELVEHERHTPSLAAEEVKALLDAKADVVVLDARRFDEYATMSIPGGTSVPGAELALRVRDLAPDPNTRVIVNCAGRTRSIIGTQSLVNAGIPNPVAALRNGTIGWLLAGQVLDHGAQRRFGGVSPANLAAAQASAQSLADRAGAVRLSVAGLAGGHHPHPVPLGRAHARGIRRRPPARLRQRAGWPAGAGDRCVRRGARCPHCAGRWRLRQRWRACRDDGALAGADGLGGGLAHGQHG